MSAGLSGVWLGLSGTGVQRQVLLAQQNYRCRYCDGPISDESALCAIETPDGLALVDARCGAPGRPTRSRWAILMTAKEPARRYGVAVAAAPQRCGARTRAPDQHPCLQYALEGSTRCKFHGAASPQAKRKARERIAEERAQAVLRTQPAEPVTDAVAALRRLCAEVLRNADAQLEAGQTTGSTTGEWIDRASRLLVELARIDGAYIDRSAVLYQDVSQQDPDLDRKLEELYGKLISKPTQARLNTLYDALDAEADGKDVDGAVLSGIETRRKGPASLMRESFTGTSLEDVPGVAVEAYLIEERVDGPEPPEDAPLSDTRLGKLPPGFGTRRSQVDGGS